MADMHDETLSPYWPRGSRTGVALGFRPRDRADRTPSVLRGAIQEHHPDHSVIGEDLAKRLAAVQGCSTDRRTSSYIFGLPTYHSDACRTPGPGWISTRRSDERFVGFGATGRCRPGVLSLRASTASRCGSTFPQPPRVHGLACEAFKGAQSADEPYGHDAYALPADTGTLDVCRMRLKAPISRAVPVVRAAEILATPAQRLFRRKRLAAPRLRLRAAVDIMRARAKLVRFLRMRTTHPSKPGPPSSAEVVDEVSDFLSQRWGPAVTAQRDSTLLANLGQCVDVRRGAGGLARGIGRCSAAPDDF